MITDMPMRGVAHDIRHLFCTIRLTAELLEGSGDEAVARRARRILRAIDRGTEICSAWVEGHETGTGPVWLRPLLEDVAQQLPQVPGIALRIDCPPKLSAEICAASAYRCLYNLAANAVDAMAGGGGCQLTLRARKIDSRLVLAVEDNGPGYGAAPAGQRAYPGAPPSAGLGGAIVENLVARMGGRLKRSSPAGGGTLFRIVLPKKKAGHPGPLSAPDLAA